MKKKIFETEVDFSKPIFEISIPSVGDVTVTTRLYDGKIWAKFNRYTPSTSIETTIEDYLTGVRLQYIVQDALIRESLSLKPMSNNIPEQNDLTRLRRCLDMFETMVKIDFETPDGKNFNITLNESLTQIRKLLSQK